MMMNYANLSKKLETKIVEEKLKVNPDSYNTILEDANIN